MTNTIAQTFKNAGFKVRHNNTSVFISLSTRKVSIMEINHVLDTELEGIQFSVKSTGNEVEIR